MSTGTFDNHSVYISERNSIEISGVKSVISFDDETVLAESIMGRITVKGEGLNISSFNEEIGELKATGKIHGVIYLAGAKSEGGFFSRILR